MKKIITKEAKEKKETRNKVIIGVVLIIVMILGTLGYAFFSGSREEVEKINYRGIEFIRSENGLWQFETEKGFFSTQYNPEDTENISIPIFRTINNYNSKPLFFVGGGPAKAEIARNLQNFVLRMQDVCIDENCEADLPAKNCSQDNIIILKEKEDIEISQDYNCIFISSPYEEQVRVADAFLFKILGIN